MESKQIRYPLGTLSKVEPMTFGQPGQRTFRLDLHSGPAICSVWLEKEQLLQLGVYLRDIVAGLSAEDKARDSRPQEAAWSGGETTIDFKAGQMSLRHDAESNSFYMQAHAQETEETPEGEGDSVSFWITVDQARELSEESLRICAAGRPICFLCGQPINPEGHVCPRANGHTVLEAG
jgi:uncharacterized repeat protein (TIGR03847 family)